MKTQRMTVSTLAFQNRLYAGIALGLGVVMLAQAGQGSTDGNIGRYRYTTGTSGAGGLVGEFATDGKLGPENTWVTDNRQPHRLNIFFDRPTPVGQLHIYSGGLGNAPVGTVSVLYLDEGGALRPAPGGAVAGNTHDFLDILLASPVTTTQIMVAVQDATATVREVAVFPPSPIPHPFGSGVDPHLARQHRIASTTASSTAVGSSRRAVVDGFVGDNDVWRSSSAANQWIALDLRDPPETSPVSVRATTTPVEIGSAHLYSGTDAGEPPVSAGRFQSLDMSSGAWVDIPGGSFAGNAAREAEIMFPSPVTTAGLRLIVQDVGAVVREIVPLPPTDHAAGWPIGSGVAQGDAPDHRAFDDHFHALEIDRSSIALATEADGSLVAREQAGSITQHFQMLLNVGTDTYRIRSRISGLCLEPENGSLESGAPIVEAEYAALPSQRWRIETAPGGVRLVNSHSGHVLTAVGETNGSAIEQRPAGELGQSWTIEFRARSPKKGTGGWGNYSDIIQNDWGYNWGPTDNFPANVEFWPMQWGSFNWNQRLSLVPGWLRNGEATVLMGYNEPDKVDQSNLSVDIAASMWPRLEAMNMPLLAPAVAGHPAFSTWIQGFMNRADTDELRLDYVGMHSYGGPNADSFMNQITDAANAWGRDVVVSEFSVVDWSNTNSWNTDQVYNWFAEVLWRMELHPSLYKYAVFIFTDEPGNPISDNRGEMREADGSLTPEGELYAAWDGDTQFRTDTPYYIHNKASFRRPGAASGGSGENSTVLGLRDNRTEAFQWRLEPTETPGLYSIRSVTEGLLLAYTARGLELHPEGGPGILTEFGIEQIQHGWFAIVEPILSRPISSNPSANGQIGLATAGTTSDSVRWRFAPVLGGPPGPVRGGAIESLGEGRVEISWQPHGFRDLVGFTIYRSGPGAGQPEPIAADVLAESWIDMVPEPGTYNYAISAVGDTGESDLVSLGAVSVDTCPADFNADFAVNSADVEDAIEAIGSGLDFDGDGAADFFDVLAFLRIHDEGCPQE